MLMKQTITTLLFLGLYVTGMGNVIDSLKAKSKNTEGAELIKTYSDLCWEYRFENVDSSLFYGDKALKLSVELNDLSGEAQAYNDLSIIQIITGNLDTAQSLLEKALAIRSQMSDTLRMAAIQNKLAIIAQKRGDLRTALDYNLRTLAIYEDAGDQQKAAMMLNNIGIIHNNLNETVTARSYLRKAYAMKMEIPDSSEAAGTLVNLGNTFEVEEQLDSAYTYFDAARAMLLECKGSPEYLAGAYNSLGRISQASGRDDEALNHFEQALTFRKSIRDKHSLSTTYVNLATLYMAQGAQSRAKTLLDSARSLIKQTDSGLEQLGLYKSLQNYYMLSGNADSTYHYGVLSFELRDSLLGEESRRVIAELETRFETEKKEREIAELIKQRAEEARTISHQMMPRALMESGLVSALEDMLNKTLGNAEFEFTFEHFGIGKKRFKPSIEVGLYRIAQELVNNIIKHSGAKHAVVQLYQTKHHLILHVEDDGAGFDIKQVKTASGIGLQNIFSRANAVNSEVSYELAAPKGTAASIRIPLIKNELIKRRIKAEGTVF